MLVAWWAALLSVGLVEGERFLIVVVVCRDWGFVAVDDYE